MHVLEACQERTRKDSGAHPRIRGAFLLVPLVAGVLIHLAPCLLKVFRDAKIPAYAGTCASKGGRHVDNQWSRRRGAFNHDWLKNQYLTALQKWMNLLDDKVEDPEFESRFVDSVLSAWEDRLLEAKSLIADFEAEMSPKSLFRHPPLSGCDDETKGWLPDITHTLWLARYPVAEWVASADAALCAAEASYRRLLDAINAREGPRSAENLRSCRADFADFLDKCRCLGQSISTFPNDVKVT